MFHIFLSFPFPPIRILQGGAQRLSSSSPSHLRYAHPFCPPWPLLPKSLFHLVIRSSLYCQTSSFLRARLNLLHLRIPCSIWRIVNVRNLFLNDLNISPCNSQMTFWCFYSTIGHHISSLGQLFEVNHIIDSHFTVEDMKTQGLKNLSKTTQ